MGVLPFTGKKVKPTNNCPVRDHLLQCNYLPSLATFSILAHENKMLSFEIRESLLMVRDNHH